MRLAYFITSYGDGVQLLRLVRVLRAGDPAAEIVVQHDETHHALDRGPLDALGVHVLLSPETIGWGDITLDRARWRVFGWILEHLDVDWVMMLSEQDHPTAPLGVLRDRLSAAASNGADVVMESWRLDDIPDPEIRVEAEQRYRFRWYALPTAGIARRLPRPLATLVGRAAGVLVHRLRKHGMPVRLALAMPAVGVPARIAFRALRTPFDRDHPCWHNSCWFALDRRAMQAVVTRVEADPALVHYYERTVIPVESMVATILGNDPSIRVEHESLHTIRWSDHRSGRPDVFTVEDVPMLVAAPHPFARKFGADPRVLDALADHVLLTKEAS
jgi:hypothetical protein